MAKATISRQRAAATRRQRSSLWRELRANFYDFGLLFRESWFYLIIFGGLIAGCTLYFSQFASNPDGSDIGKAIFHSLQLMIFQINDNQFPHTVAGEILFIAVPVLGVTLIIQSVVNFSRLLFDKSSRRETWQVALAETFHNHVIVGGLGRLGFRVVSRLIDAGNEVVVITSDWNAPFVSRMLELRVPVVVGDAREVKVLRQAGVNRAHAVIAIVNDDVINLEIALTAREENPAVRTVVRLFTDEMAQSLKKNLPASIGFSTSALASSTFAVAIMHHNLDYVMPVGADLMAMSEIVVKDKSYLCGDRATIEAKELIRVVQHRDRTNRVLHSKDRATVKAGDTLLLAGDPKNLDKISTNNNNGTSKTELEDYYNDHFDTIIVCGLGKVGFRVVNILYHHYLRPTTTPIPKLRLVVIHMDDPKHAHFLRQVQQLAQDLEKEKEDNQALKQIEIKIIPGDATDESILTEAGIERAFALAALTSDDNVNLQIGQAARGWWDRELNKTPSLVKGRQLHLVLRVFNDVLADRLSDLFGIHTAYSTSGLASPTLAAAAIEMDINHSFSGYNQLFADFHYVVPEHDRYFAQKSVGEIQANLGISVIAVNNTFLPALTTLITPKNELTLLGPIEQIKRLRK